MKPNPIESSSYHVSYQFFKLSYQILYYEILKRLNANFQSLCVYFIHLYCNLETSELINDLIVKRDREKILRMLGKKQTLKTKQF